MGIPSYFRWVAAKYDTIIQKKLNLPVARLFLDLNCAIHPCARRVTEQGYQKGQREEWERKICVEVVRYIEHLLHFCTPTQMLFISIDGVAPRAKMAQQRSRRFKSVKENKQRNEILQRLDPNYQSKDRWDTNAITPGTIFMHNLSKYLQLQIPKLQALQGIEVVLSDSNQPGEGEHKILQYIRHNSADMNPESYDVIYGLDADLIMLSMTCTHRHMALLRETIEFKNTVRLDEDDMPVMLYLDIKEFTSSLYREMIVSGLDPKTTTQEGAVRDYVALCFLLGNDFLPHPLALSIRTGSVGLLTELYTQTSHGDNPNLIMRDDQDHLSFNWQFLANLFEVLAKKEDQLLLDFQRKILRPYRKEYESVLEKELDMLERYPCFHRQLENEVKLGVPGWQQRYYQKCCHHCEETEITEMCQHYFQGLIWTLRYYMEECPCCEWYYPYHFVPTLADLSRYLTKEGPVLAPDFRPTPHTPFQQLLMVLPSESANLLPKSYQKLMTQWKSPIISYYPTSFHNETFGKIFMWESPPILPPISGDVIKGIANTCSLSSTEKERNNVRSLVSLVESTA